MIQVFIALQVERKRHVGNDIVNIIFYEVDGDTLPSFKPSMMKTHFTRILSTAARLLIT